jgi:hypothetical protein
MHRHKTAALTTGGSRQAWEVDGDYQYMGGAAKRVRELGGGLCRMAITDMTITKNPLRQKGDRLDFTPGTMSF